MRPRRLVGMSKTNLIINGSEGGEEGRVYFGEKKKTKKYRHKLR